MASRVRLSLPCPDATEPERPPRDLTSDLLEEIFLRVASPADLARASTACVSFRRLIADHSFLRRYRSIHPPLLLGLLSRSTFQPVEAPHPSAAVARAVARAADFCFDYLPRPAEGHRWFPRDVRYGRVLLERRSFWEGLVYWDLAPLALAVCDPLSRRYLLLPPVEPQNKYMFNSGASFIPSGGIEEDTSFNVICWVASITTLGVFVFSSVSGRWSVSTSTHWDDLGLPKADMPTTGQLMPTTGQWMNGCFYWKLKDASMLIKLDMNIMQFCTLDLPPDHNEREIVIVESEGCKVAMFSMIDEGTSVDYYTFSQNGYGKSHEWQMKSTIPLPAHYTSKCFLGGPAEGYIFLECIREDGEPSAVFSLEIKSFNIERIIERAGFSFFASVFPYFWFPTISVSREDSRI